MQFVNIADPEDVVSFEESLLRGIGRNSGLYFPTEIPRLSQQDLDSLKGASRQEVARTMLTPWLEDEIPPNDLKGIITEASTFDTTLVDVGDKKILELFHGPTLAFKDVAAGYLAALMSYFNKKADRESVVLVATSGDTGGAIAHGFGGIDRVKVVVLYPKNRVSHLQQEQLRRVEPNVYTLEVDGSFDDCQSLVKQAMADQQLTADLHLTSANSISIGRLLPQSTYYGSAYAQLGESVGRFVVPSGNLGNLTGGILAYALGVPIYGFLSANNRNDTFARYVSSGEYQPAETIATISNAMDVGAPNNLPRLAKLFDEDVDALRKVVKATSVSDEETIETIKQVYDDTGYLLDPHTAVAWRASEAMPAENASDIIIATASPLKFAEEIVDKTGIRVDNTSQLEALRQQPERFWEIDNSTEQLSKFLTQQL